MSNEYEVEEKSSVNPKKFKLKEPGLHQIVMLNDDYTPMDFVVHVLETFFYHSSDKAKDLMLQIHNKGQAICGVFSRDVAESKATIINQYSADQQHPLMCDVQLIEDINDAQ